MSFYRAMITIMGIIGKWTKQLLFLPLATGFGDPHMVTLDGTPFTFNGHGEYFILKVSRVNFTLQGRMEPLSADDGTLTRATVYTAFAAREAGSDTVQVRNSLKHN